MFAVLASWGAVAIVVPVLISIGIGVLSMNPPAYIISRVAFTFAALILLIRIGYWLALEQSKRGLQPYVFGFVIFGVICVLWLWAMKSISAREHIEKVIVSPREITLAHQANKNLILRITNNHDFVIFDVHLGVSIDNNILPLSSILIDAINAEKIPDIPFSMYRLGLSNGCFGILVGSINPHSTREFSVKIEGDEIKTDSRISFTVYAWSLAPALFDLRTTPVEKLPKDFKEFYGDDSVKRSDKIAHVYAQKMKLPTNSYFQKGNDGKWVWFVAQIQ